MLFEKNTYLNLCYVNRSNPNGVNDGSAELAEKMEKLSHHMKLFKNCCYRNATTYKSVEIKNSRHSMIMSEFTEYTIIMLISYNPDIRESFLNYDVIVIFFSTQILERKYSSS